MKALQRLLPRHWSIRAKALFGIFAIEMLLTVAFSLYVYRVETRSILAGIDDKLLTATYAIPRHLAADYHDRATHSNAIAAVEYNRALRDLSDYAQTNGIEYLYTAIVQDGRVYFTASSATAEELADGEIDPYFTPYTEEDEDISTCLHTHRVIAGDYEDEYGRVRSMLVPMVSPGGRPYVAGADMAIDFIEAQAHRTLLDCARIAGLFFVGTFAFSAMLLNRFVAPLSRLARHTEDLAHRDFTMTPACAQDIAAIARRTTDEVGKLAVSVQFMHAKLLEYLENLKAATAAKERIESELKIAHDIQMSLLRKLFPAFPDRADIDLRAVLDPAREVGGDFYDFAMLDDHRLFACIGDVSDKGVPAALFMAVTMALFRRIAKQPDATPARILELVNEELAGENSNLMFVTAFCAILDLQTGELVYSNAGHNAPVIVSAAGPAAWLPLPKGIALGVMPGARFTTRTLRLAPGAALLMYTDGVTEAKNPASELFGNDRLLALASGLPARDSDSIVQRVMRDVAAFAATAPQSDDITVLVVRTTAAVPAA